MSQSHFPPSLGYQTLNHHMDNNIISISHPPSSVIEAAPGTNNFNHPGSQRKFTLLARPQQHLSSNPSISSYQHTLNSAEHINSVSCLNQQPPLIQSPGPVIQSPGSMAGRAARNDYYDTEDPSVNLHEFIVNSMQAQKNRIILIKLEEEFIAYVSDPSRIEPLKLPPWDSYHRMLAHRVAAYFGLEHNVDPMDKARVIVGKGPNTRMPQIRFGDYLALNDDSESPEPKLILKRAPKDIAPLDKFEAALAAIETSSSDMKLKSYEEREEEYEKARARIFSQQSPLQSNHSILSFDLATKSNQRISSSLFPSVMHHRRAASDTAMFKRAITADMKKECSLSSRSSRSATPLVFSTLRSTGSCELLSSSVDSRVQPPSIPPQTSPKIVQQQQLHASVFESQGQASQFHSPTAPSSISNSPSKYNASRTLTQHNNDLAITTASSGTATTSIQYQHVQAGLPVMYPHPQAAVLADPNWYPYQQMMLYQVSPQGYVPTAAHYVGGGSPQLIPGPVYHPYSVTPGVIGQHALVSPPVSTPPQHLAYPGSVGAIARLPIGVDQVSSPSHQNSGVTLVRPISQHPSSMRLTKLEGTWNIPQSHQFNMQQPIVPQQISSPGQAAFAAVLPISQQLTPSHLADQMENNLHLSASNGDCITSDNADNDITPQREVSSKSRMRLVSYDSVPSGDRIENDSGFMSHVVPRVPGNGPFPVSTIGEPPLYGGQMISPTHPQGPVQYMQPQQSVYGAGNQDGGGYVTNQGVVPNSAIHYSPGTVSQPSTPTIGPLNLAPPGILHAQQGIFSPPSTGITRSPVQILGHTLGTSLFSPPPSSGNQHGLFVNSPASTGKVGVSPGTPSHPPVGSGTRFRHDSTLQGSGHISEVSASISQSGFHSLPPRLAQQQGQKSGNRYQNQRHPSNRVSVKGNNHTGSTGPVTLGDHMPSQFISVSGNSNANKREPLLPTPPSTQMVKLDTNLTCGVPLHIMEIVGCPAEGSPEKIQALKAVNKLSGIVDVKSGKMNKTGEEVTIAIFNCQDTAMQALQIQHSQFSLSIPRNNHAKFILSMLQM